MTRIKPVTAFDTEKDGTLVASYGDQKYRFREALGSDLVLLEKQLKKQEGEEEETDAETLAMILATLGNDDIPAQGYLSLPLLFFRALGAEVMSTFRD